MEIDENWMSPWWWITGFTCEFAQNIFIGDWEVLADNIGMYSGCYILYFWFWTVFRIIWRKAKNDYFMLEIFRKCELEFVSMDMISGKWNIVAFNGLLSAINGLWRLYDDSFVDYGKSIYVVLETNY